MWFASMDSPIGPLLLAADADGLRRIAFARDGVPAKPEPGWQHAPEQLAAARAQLDQYFAGTRQRFELPLAPQGTAFQRQVWQVLQGVGFGVTVSYGELARRLGRPTAVRAVGAANGRNPLPIVIPCHRVIGADGSLTGFAGGLAIKRALLRGEGVLC
ncbi:methylated-DNA--[protein]-cysteine S-methyltransferase [Haliangium ochraceum]|uniref:Methylated-DNA--protein-cysteine methyltransferase n=1 Tax=Haliangium ochraceum (strain DSM 14365 / JCM 11303 / SMP-2) TaxID=502025 RepID=D0LZR1_HALO1|nr:methylated-DNA/protein-cysteinemethyltransferase [Haliangium ochraceum DSM 14365]